jgi:hypothetical protein
VSDTLLVACQVYSHGLTLYWSTEPCHLLHLIGLRSLFFPSAPPAVWLGCFYAGPDQPLEDHDFDSDTAEENGWAEAEQLGFFDRRGEDPVRLKPFGPEDEMRELLAFSPSRSTFSQANEVEMQPATSLNSGADGANSRAEGVNSGPAGVDSGPEESIDWRTTYSTGSPDERPGGSGLLESPYSSRVVSTGREHEALELVELPPYGSQPRDHGTSLESAQTYDAPSSEISVDDGDREALELDEPRPSGSRVDDASTVVEYPT